MTSTAILMMIIAMAIIWGGLVASIARLPKEEQDD
ncbi:MAG: methionine/alanine import family NSS transporter small subunit [Alysiella sp.]|nr:methionine/alanine import family NSS transporter small subunit [Alysiella sp.]MDO4433249.1 methionine/alanine import family NSS transporter small subunit [Alysiella sp.]